MSRVLIVEDQKRLLASVRKGLEEEGYEVVTAVNGEEGYYLGTTQQFDVFVLDVMLPGRDGIQVLRDLRRQGVSKPVLLLTSRDSIEDRVKGLDAGADDYLIKPFAFAELHARLRALLRRNLGNRELLLRADNLEIDLLARRVVRDGAEIELSKREFDLLEFLLRHKNMTVTRDTLGREVWKEPEGMWTNVIEVCINSLRKKVERPGQRLLIHTIRGVGYALRDDA
jgi:two-component system copper resistance phosphate regulon response regulator CusR